MPSLLGIANVPVGDHVTARTPIGTLNLDTIWVTALAGLIVLTLGLIMRRQATSGVPGKLQLFWEFLVGTVSDQVETSIGPQYREAVPVAVTLFIFILTANWIEILPGVYHNTDYLPAASADVNLTYALALLVALLTNWASIRKRGLAGHVGNWFLAKPRGMFWERLLGEITRPVTLALRLFGNLFAGGIMIALILAFTTVVSSPATAVVTVVWKLFDMFIGAIQAFIFSLLTILYYEFAVAEEH
ncbi:MAG TPA: F0F1 ATP synthase subunit A [Acidimicrobiales bacterium]|nr:F0F1 ATP synthase subunit A [Acidimicrobiales bacterium]